MRGGANMFIRPICNPVPLACCSAVHPACPHPSAKASPVTLVDEFEGRPEALRNGSQDGLRYAFCADSGR